MTHQFVLWIIVIGLYDQYIITTILHQEYSKTVLNEQT